MSDYIEITNLSRHAFRRAGRSFPAGADNAVIIKADTLTKAQKSAIENEPRLSVKPCPPPQVAPKTAPKSPPKAASKDTPKSSEASNETKPSKADKKKDA